MKLKVCGLSNPIEIETCINNDVDFCGFILNFPKSHRFINYEKAEKLLSIYKKKIQYVGVLVNPSLEEFKKFSKLNLDYFQLYGQYDSKFLIEIKNKFKKKIIMTIQVKNKSDIENYKKVEDGSDIILWDSTGYEKSLAGTITGSKILKLRRKMIAGDNKR